MVGTRPIKIEVFLIVTQGVVEINADGVVAQICFGFVEFGGGVDLIDVIAGPTVHRVDAGVPAQKIIAFTAEQPVIALAADERVVAG